MKKIVCIFNFPSHYSFSISQKMANELNCDFYFGDKIKGDIKKFDTSKLQNFKSELKIKYLLGHFYYMKGCMQAIENYDVIILTGEPYCLSNWLVLFISKFKSKKVYFWTHGWYGRESWIKSVIKKTYFNLATGLLLYGNYARNLMLNEGFSSDRMTVIYNSLDYDSQLLIRNQLKESTVYFDYFKNNDPVIIFTGRLIKDKKLDKIFEAISELKKQQINCNLILIGTGEMESLLKSYADKMDIANNVWFYGSCYDENIISELVYNAAVCVSPGAIGLTAIHSMTYGTPVITHDNFKKQGPEFEAIVENVTGNFFKEDDLEDLCYKIKEWINNYNRSAVRGHCYNVVDKCFNPYTQIEILKDLFCK